MESYHSLPPLSRYANQGMKGNQILFAEEPWMRTTEYIVQPSIWQPYIDAGRMLPDRTLERALFSYEWQNRVAIPHQSRVFQWREWAVGSGVHTAVGMPEDFLFTT